MSNIKNKLSCNKYIIIILLFSFLIGLPFIWNYVNGDDTIFHLINIDLYNNSSYFDKVLSSGNKGFGSGIGIFYPCLPHIIISMICKLTKLSSLKALNLFKIIVIILSSISMYITSYKINNSKLKGAISSMIYVSSSYFYIELFTRDAINEVMLFIFFPLIFLSFYYLFNKDNKKKFFIIFTISYICMIYCHLVMSLFFTILLVPFLLIYIKKILNKDNFKVLIIASLFILIFTSTFTLPLLEHMILDKWNLPFKSSWVLPFTSYLRPLQFDTNDRGGLLYINIAIPVLLLFLFSFIVMIKNNVNRKFQLGLLIFILISFLFSCSNLFWNNAPDFFKTIQFAWRLTSFVIVGISIYTVNGFDLFNDKFAKIIAIILILYLFKFSYGHYCKVRFDNNIKYDTNVLINDYLPSKSYDDLKYFEKMDSDTINGNGNIEIINNKNGILEFNISNVDNKTVLELPRFYYLGYNIVDENNKKINYFESEHGLINIKVQNGTYRIRYSGTNVYKICVLLKGLLILFVCIIMLNKYLYNKKEI